MSPAQPVHSPSDPILTSPQQSLAIGIDIGGTSVKVGVIALSTGEIKHKSGFPTPTGTSHEMAMAIASHVSSLPTEFKTDKIGVGVPGAMNLDRSIVRYPPNLQGWKEEPLKQYLEEALPGYTVALDNDAKVATLAEAKLGAGKGYDYFMLATLGTGVGGGIWANGIFRGASGGAGEFGHVSIDYNGPDCACGAKGCIEAYLGQKYLTKRTLHKLAHTEVNSLLREYNEETLEPKVISKAAEQGDAFAISVLEEAGELLGIAFASVAKLLDIHTFIVGGGVANAGGLLLDAAQEALEEHVLRNQREYVLVTSAHFGNAAGIIGAALLTAEL